jgi:hypothetical protein
MWQKHVIINKLPSVNLYKQVCRRNNSNKVEHMKFPLNMRRSKHGDLIM